MTSQRISLSDSPSFAGTRSISADGDLYGLVSNEILILSSADGVLYETSFKRHNVNDHRAATSDSPLQNARTSRLGVQYARHGRDLMGCKSAVHSFGFFIESHYTKM